jgi:hypothetical protein
MHFSARHAYKRLAVWLVGEEGGNYWGCLLNRVARFLALYFQGSFQIA